MRRISVTIPSNKFYSWLVVLGLWLAVASADTKRDNHHLPLLSFFSVKRKDGNPASMCRAHSHNDYHQADPLASALKHGLKCVEVDVFPRKGGLWVAHTVFGLDPRRTIESMYLQPLVRMFQRSEWNSRNEDNTQGLSSLAVPVSTRASARPGWMRRRGPGPALLKANPRGGSDSINTNKLNRRSLPSTHPPVDSLNLLVDFKGHADESASLLQKSLTPLRPFLSKVDRNGIFHQGRLTVLISGNRPSVASLQASNGERFLFLDGRRKDLHTASDTHLVPLVSMPWRNIRLARLLGRGEAHMRKVAAQAHAQGKLVRIWGCPNEPRIWRQMLRGNIDLLSIDDHAKFASFVAAKKQQCQ